jgi:hypothetical protein
MWAAAERGPRAVAAQLAQTSAPLIAPNCCRIGPCREEATLRGGERPLSPARSRLASSKTAAQTRSMASIPGGSARLV